MANEASSAAQGKEAWSREALRVTPGSMDPFVSDISPDVLPLRFPCSAALISFRDEFQQGCKETRGSLSPCGNRQLCILCDQRSA